MLYISRAETTMGDVLTFTYHWFEAECPFKSLPVRGCGSSMFELPFHIDKVRAEHEFQKLGCRWTSQRSMPAQTPDNVELVC